MRARQVEPAEQSDFRTRRLVWSGQSEKIGALPRSSQGGRPVKLKNEVYAVFEIRNQRTPLRQIGLSNHLGKYSADGCYRHRKTWMAPPMAE